MSDFDEQPDTGISRRTVTKAMAWAVPAIAIAAPVPAFAGASQDFVTFTGRACKDPGGGQNKFYYFQVKITNSSQNALTVDFTGVVVNGVNGDASTITPNPYQVPAYTECVVTLRFGVFPDSANGSATLSYSVNGDPQPPVGSGTINNLPPLTDSGGGSCPISYPSSVCTPLN